MGPPHVIRRIELCLQTRGYARGRPVPMLTGNMRKGTQTPFSDLLASSNNSSSKVGMQPGCPSPGCPLDFLENSRCFENCAML